MQQLYAALPSFWPHWLGVGDGAFAVATAVGLELATWVGRGVAVGAEEADAVGRGVKDGFGVAVGFITSVQTNSPLLLVTSVPPSMQHAQIGSEISPGPQALGVEEGFAVGDATAVGEGFSEGRPLGAVVGSRTASPPSNGFGVFVATWVEGSSVSGPPRYAARELLR